MRRVLDALSVFGLVMAEALRTVRRRPVAVPLTAGHIVLSIAAIGQHRLQSGELNPTNGTFDGLFARLWELSLAWTESEAMVWAPLPSVRFERLPLHERPVPGIGRRTQALRRLIALGRNLESAIRAGEYGVITAHDPHLLGLLGLVVARRTGVPFVLHLNSDFENKYRQTGRVSFPWLRWRWLERCFEHWIMGAADAIVADRKYYRDSGYVPARYHAKYTAVGVFSPLTALPRRTPEEVRADLHLGNAPIVLYVGRLHPHKLADDLIPFALQLAERHPSWTLVLAGDGPLRDSMTRAAVPLGERVRFLGNQTPEQVAELYQAADVLVATHGGVTLLEAARAGKATVAYDYDWMSEFIRDGETGWLVPVRDSQALAATVARILANPRLARRCGDAAQADVRDHYQRATALANERRVYEALAGHRQ